MMGSIGLHLNPISGILSSPYLGTAKDQTFVMNSRSVLARNFNKLRDSTPTLYKFQDIVDAGGGTNGTLGRAIQRGPGVKLVTVEQLAKVYGLEPWQMLVPTLEAETGKNGKPVIHGLPDWPFPDIDQKRFNKLLPRQQSEIQGVVRDRIEAFEAINEKKKRA